MARPKKASTMITISVRLPAKMLAEIDQHAVRLRDETPLLNIERADAIRHLLALALKEAAAGSKRRR
jgi:metal-responsive CopG/Arc/MetJ family transcriptional regulator